MSISLLTKGSSVLLSLTRQRLDSLPQVLLFSNEILARDYRLLCVLHEAS